jgi:hypothetical protein
LPQGEGNPFGGAPNCAGRRSAAHLSGDPKGLLISTSSAGGTQSAADRRLSLERLHRHRHGPTDDCTLWYARDYWEKGAVTYSTRIEAFRIPGCK